MEKEQADPWDDSALLNAFTHAITKYKKMHMKESSHNLNGNDGREEITISSAKIVESANDSSPTEEIQQTDLQPQEVYTETSNVPPMQEVVEGYPNSQGVDTYNNLLNQYYELEEQRQNVLQQLQQTGYWNNQYATEALGQEIQDLNQQASHPTTTSYCCPYVCPCLATPCSSIPSCSLGGASVSKKDIESTSIACTQSSQKLCSGEDDSIVKTAMGAAERAISSINNVHEGSSEGKVKQGISPETDISVVLNAWYSAGFYTGKYLTEQSNAKERR
ncbi:hypothetical protein ACHQM5_020912 [Ranunculus cassubicifolius]